jgi:hypothetical protein
MTDPSPTAAGPDPPDPVDVAVGLSVAVVSAATAVARRTRPLLDPVVGATLRPPGLPERLQPGHWLSLLGIRGAAHRVTARNDLAELSDRLVPLVAAEVLRRVDVATLLAEQVDLDRVVSAVDLDAAADRVDVDRIVNRLDLTAIVLERVNLEAVVDAVLSHVDVVGLAEGVIDEIDLPGLIRESTGSMASETVRGARMQGIAGDEAVGRAVDRLLRRRGRSSTPQAPPQIPTQAPPQPPGAVPGTGMPVRP